MKRFVSFFAISFAIICLSCVRYGWGIGEKKLISQPLKVMRILDINDSNDVKILRMHSQNLSKLEIKTPLYKMLIDKMITTIKESSPNGVGIAAPQVGILRRVVVVKRFDKPGEPFEAYPNIKITEKRGEMICGREGCLSIPNQTGYVKRSHDITISYLSPDTFMETTETVKGFTAVIFQHECDHLDGILYTDRIWDDESSWYRNSKDINEQYADVFYIASTDVISSFDEDGREVYRAALTDDDKRALYAEMDFVSNNIFNDSLNFISPYYHQHTYNAITLSEAQFDSIKTDVNKEINVCFDYYIRNINHGRKFILAGFSQGGMCVIDILKHMSDSTYSNMAAAYAMGYGLSNEDLKCTKIRPAVSSDDKGVCISFNTCRDTTTIWSPVYNESVCCINPVNWKTDTTSTVMEYKGVKYTIRLDKTKQILLVPDYKDTAKYNFTPLWPEGNLHHYDLLFYSKLIGQNAKDRVYR